MENGERVNETGKRNKDRRGGKNKGIKGAFGRFWNDLRSTDAEIQRSRLAKLAAFALRAIASYFLCGAELFFGTLPLPLALVCSSGEHLPAVAIGLIPHLFSGTLGNVYAFGIITAFLSRILSALLPQAAALFSDKCEVVSYEDKHPTENGSPRRTGGTGSVRSPSGASGERTEVARGLLREMWHVRLLCAGIGGVVCGILIMIKSQYSFYSLCASLTLTLISPLAVAALGGVFGGSGREHTAFFRFSLCLVLGLCTYASVGGSFLGMPASPFLAMLFTLFVCSEYGLVTGLAAALCCGASLELIYLPLLLICAVLFSLVSAIKRSAGAAATLAAVAVWCYYIGGENGLIYVFPPMLLAIPFYFIAYRFRELLTKSVASDAEPSSFYFAEAVTQKSKNEAVRERLEALNDAFSTLSETFYRLSDRFRRPDTLGIKRIAENAFEENCRTCRNREICFGARYAETLDAMKRVTSALHTRGAAEAEDLTQEFCERCIRKDEILKDVNLAVSETTESLIRGEQIGLFSSGCDDVTALLKDALECDADEYECDADASARIYTVLRSLSLDVRAVVVYGKRCLHVIVKGTSLCEKVSPSLAGEICRRSSEILECELTEPTFEVSRDGNLMIMYSRPVIKAFCANGKLPSDEFERAERDGTVDPFATEKEALCGDSAEAFITDLSYFYSLISDGMGSGSEAAFTSGVCAMFIEKMLSAGNRADITLRMLNSVLRSENMGCGSECSATVDLLELDLMSGEAAFIKSGAAPTYIARGGTVYKISSRTMPVGIIKSADAKITKFDTKTGDLIVMMSDGCCPDSEDCPWLVEYLCAAFPTGLPKGEAHSELCERIKEEVIDLAVRNYPPDKERDDISVSVVIVGE